MGSIRYHVPQGWSLLRVVGPVLPDGDLNKLEIPLGVVQRIIVHFGGPGSLASATGLAVHGGEHAVPFDDLAAFIPQRQGLGQENGDTGRRPV